MSKLEPEYDKENLFVNVDTDREQYVIHNFFAKLFWPKYIQTDPALLDLVESNALMIKEVDTYEEKLQLGNEIYIALLKKLKTLYQYENIGLPNFFGGGLTEQEKLFWLSSWLRDPKVFVDIVCKKRDLPIIYCLDLACAKGRKDSLNSHLGELPQKEKGVQNNDWDESNNAWADFYLKPIFERIYVAFSREHLTKEIDWLSFIDYLDKIRERNYIDNPRKKVPSEIKDIPVSHNKLRYYYYRYIASKVMIDLEDVNYFIESNELDYTDQILKRHSSSDQFDDRDGENIITLLNNPYHVEVFSSILEKNFLKLSPLEQQVLVNKSVSKQSNELYGIRKVKDEELITMNGGKQVNSSAIYKRAITKLTKYIYDNNNESKSKSKNENKNKKDRDTL